MFQLELLPAKQGDCLWIEYGPEENPHIVIIDGGVKATSAVLDKRIGRAMEERGTSDLHVELLVVTHLDNDHIQGILRLLQETQHRITFGDIWFNGNRQLLSLMTTEGGSGEEGSDVLGGEATDLLGFSEADDLSSLLAEAERGLPWNTMFEGSAVMVSGSGELPCRVLNGGLKLTLLGPSAARLRKLGEKWPGVLEEYKLQERTGVAEEPSDVLGKGDTWPPHWEDDISSDAAIPNGSSIVLLVEYAGNAYLLPGDAFAIDVMTHLERLMTERNIVDKFPLTAFKLSHHGSKANISKSLIEKVKCGEYLISTDGTGHKHPDHQAILRVLRYSSVEACLSFNYETETTHLWRDDPAAVGRLGFGTYKTKFPDNAERGLILVWDSDIN